MYIVLLDPQRVGHLDVLLPIVLQLRKSNPDLMLDILYIDPDQFQILKKNRFLNEMVNSVGQAVLLKSPGSKGSLLKKAVVGVKLFCYLLKILTSRRVIFFQWKSLDSLASRMFGSVASIKGKSLTYQPMNNHYIEEMRRYFDEFGSPRDERAESLWLRQFSNKINVGDGALINSVDSLNYFAMMGYSNFHIIGYTHLYPEYTKYLQANYRSHLSLEIPSEKLDHRVCFGIFVNKFWGKWGGQSDDWFVDRFCEIIDCLKELEHDPVILVRGHPTLKTDVIERAVAKSGYEDIHITYLHPAIIGIASKAVIGITESTAYHYVMGVGTVYIDYGGMRLENYEIFPEGSLNASYGTIVAKNREELSNVLSDEMLLEAAVENYQPLIKHKINLSIFE